MPQDSPKPEKPPARPINRWSMGTLSMLQTVLLAVTLLAANYLSIHHFQRADLSRDQEYSLSQATRKYLKGPALSERSTPVRWVMAYRRTSPFYDRVRALAEEYERLSGGKIELILVDPLRSPERMQEINAAYGITLVRDLIIIDARNDESPVTTESAERIKTLNPHIKIVPAEQMATFSVSDGERRVSGFQGEDMLTSQLVESIEGQPRKMALITDKSSLPPRDQSEARKTLEDILRFQNVQLHELDVAGLEEIPADIEGLVIVDPKYDFTEQEISVLDAFWNRPRAALLALIGNGQAPARLKAFLRTYGVTPQNDRIVSLKDKQLVTAAQARFSEGVPFTRELARQTTEFGGVSSSLSVREGAEDLLNRRIYPMSLLEVSPEFWGETTFGQGQPEFDEQSDHAPPLHLAASVTRGAQADDRFAADTSRMVVISNSDFLDPLHHRAENLDFLASSINWLVGRESLTGISPRALSTYKLPLLQAQMSFINRCNLIFLPAALLLMGTFIWSSRRA